MADIDKKMPLIDPKEVAKAVKLDNKLGGDLLVRFLMQLTKLNKVNALYESHSKENAAAFIDHALSELNVSYDINEADLARIPKNGAFVTVSNHPLGGIDGLILMSLLLKVRPDFKVMGNFLLNKIAPLHPLIIPVNPFEQFKEASSSLAGMKASLGQLADGSPLGIFPAGEVSTFQNDAKVVIDKPWNNTIAKLITKSQVPVIPIYFEGENSLIFHLLGQIHPLLRTARLPTELFNKKGKSVKVRIGTAIPPKQLNEFPKAAELTAYLRAKTYALGSKLEVPSFFKKFSYRPSKKQQAIIAPVAHEQLKAEIEQALVDYPLLKSDSFEIFCAPAVTIPKVLKELGRLREITFREVGEGTNNSSDLDPFDLYYHHLVIWDRANEKIVGAYRLCKGKLALHQHGKRGFYLSTLFKIDDAMLPMLAESIELGRSFIVKEYQRKPLSLFLLWKGIFYYLLKNPEYRYLIGPVSISNDFSSFSRNLIVEFIKRNYYDEEIAQYIRPRKDFRLPENKKIDSSLIIKSLEKSIPKLDAFIKDIEFGFGAPVLLKKYLKLNAKMVGFNVDPKFNNALDGLVVVDILGIDPDFIKSLAKDVDDPSILKRFES
jgi:putative hemolysin